MKRIDIKFREIMIKKIA